MSQEQIAAAENLGSKSSSTISKFFGKLKPSKSKKNVKSGDASMESTSDMVPELNSRKSVAPPQAHQSMSVQTDTSVFEAENASNSAVLINDSSLETLDETAEKPWCCIMCYQGKPHNVVENLSPYEFLSKYPTL